MKIVQFILDKLNELPSVLQIAILWSGGLLILFMIISALIDQKAWKIMIKSIKFVGKSTVKGLLKSIESPVTYPRLEIFALMLGFIQALVGIIMFFLFLLVIVFLYQQGHLKPGLWPHIGVLLLVLVLIYLILFMKAQSEKLFIEIKEKIKNYRNTKK